MRVYVLARACQTMVNVAHAMLQVPANAVLTSECTGSP